MELALRHVRAPQPLATAGATLPPRVKLLNWGRNETTEGVVIVDDLTASVFAANQKSIGRERVALDYEHNTVPGTPEFNRTSEPRPVAGHCQLVCVPGQGIFGEAITYTASGQANAANYEDLSLSPYLDAEGRVIAAHSAALTHAGAAYGINFSNAALSAGNSIAADLKILSAGKTPVATPTPHKTMSEKFIALVTLSAALGLPETADEPAVLAKLKERLTPPTAFDPAPLAARMDALEKKVPAGNVDLTPLTARLDALENRIKANIDAVTLADKERLVTLMAKDGKAPVNPSTRKIYTAEELKGMDLATLQLLEANTPVTVPLSARTRTSTGATAEPGLKGIQRVAAAINAEIASK